MDALELVRLYCYKRKGVDIDELLKSCGNWYSMIIMIIFMMNIMWVVEYLMNIRRVFFLKSNDFGCLKGLLGEMIMKK